MNTLFDKLLPRVAARFQGIRRHSGLPYITHTLEVVCAQHTLQEKVLALLHDYAELSDLQELADLNIPDELLEKAHILAKPFGCDVPEQDSRHCDYIRRIACDPMCCKVKYHDLATNDWREESPRYHGTTNQETYPRAFVLLRDALAGKIYFGSKSFAVDIFSNFYPVELMIEGKCWKSAEHYYQAAKFSSRYSPEPKEDIYRAITKAPTALATKLLANEHFSPVARREWDNSCEKFEVTARMLNAKYAPGSFFRRELQQTGGLELIHESRSDMLWGTNRRGKGRNLLGKTLMLMRERNGNCHADNMFP